jgi:hypothetical protein
VTHFGAQSLGTREIPKIYDWFRQRTTQSTEPADAADHFTTGVFVDAAGSRPEYAASMRAFVTCVQEGGDHV